MKYPLYFIIAINIGSVTSDGTVVIISTIITNPIFLRRIAVHPIYNVSDVAFWMRVAPLLTIIPTDLFSGAYSVISNYDLCGIHLNIYQFKILMNNSVL